MNPSILIAGIGISGEQAALLALIQGFDVSICDSGSSSKTKERLKYLKKKGCQVISSDKISLENFDLAVISPGIDPRSPFGQAVHESAREVISEIEFASRFCKTPVIGITGTNGKTTVTEIICHSLNSLGKKAVAAGNIGYPLSQAVIEHENIDFIVCELSSFQLEAIKDIQFYGGILLNISSDHADRYNDIADYAAAKATLLKHSNLKIASQELQSHEALKGIDGIKFTQFSLNDEKITFKSSCFNYNELPLEGLHNVSNLCNIMNLLSEAGFSKEETWETYKDFTPPLHRMQHFLSWKGIEFYNDSKATNPHALLMALKSLGNLNKKNIVLIAGGRDKKMDFSIVNTAVSSYVRRLFIYGECRLDLFAEWNSLTCSEICEDFAAAVNKALNSLQKDDILLLSPACASLDSFGSYAERGNKFIKKVLEWTENEK